jgi:hypothetical protein
VGLSHALVLGQLGRCLVHSGCFGGVIAAREALEVLFGFQKLEKVGDVLVVCPDFSRAPTGALIQRVRATLY